MSYILGSQNKSPNLIQNKHNVSGTNKINKLRDQNEKKSKKLKKERKKIL
jgi:hypothetical protein